MTPVTVAYIKAHAILFMGNTLNNFSEASSDFISLLDSHISICTERFLEMGYLIAIANCLGLLAYGSSSSILAKALSRTEENVGSVDVEMGQAAAHGHHPSEGPDEGIMFAYARELFVQTIDVTCQRVDDSNILSFIHVNMIFMVFLSQSPSALQLVSEHFPWASLVTMLNEVPRGYSVYARIESDGIPLPEENYARPTPEEFALRGLDFAEYYFPTGWFENHNIDDENMYMENRSLNRDYRTERILWLGRQLANRCAEISYSSSRHKFVVVHERDEAGDDDTDEDWSEDDDSDEDWSEDDDMKTDEQHKGAEGGGDTQEPRSLS
jgi:hypothetical protein